MKNRVIFKRFITALFSAIILFAVIFDINTRKREQDNTDYQPVITEIKENDENDLGEKKVKSKHAVSYNIVANSRTSYYHIDLNCPAAKRMKEENKTYMTCTIWEAESLGYIPCSKCCR